MPIGGCATALGMIYFLSYHLLSFKSVLEITAIPRKNEKKN
ncbi:hypothetical protein Pse7429DRAFT_4557 [Pseudanabaena biceps PCC 7429]|uniref:Uncharacterized protein n=1 Tax=Pseudanabaena biceps PCC 7429 TaxID=927668 RepID=L8MWI5_9CYAN|nr:hypothetical protein Pse7429DRAFT_4557 [Pseudanabaena biceps PCC 7429]